MMDLTFARTTYCLDELRLNYHKALSERQRIPVTEWNLSNTSLTRFGSVAMGCVPVITSAKEVACTKPKRKSGRLRDSGSPKVVRGNWHVIRIVKVYPGQDGKVRNVRVKTRAREYQRPVLGNTKDHRKCIYARCVGNYVCVWRLSYAYRIQACSSRLLLGCV